MTATPVAVIRAARRPSPRAPVPAVPLGGMEDAATPGSRSRLTPQALSTLLPSIGGWGVRELLYAGLLGSLPDPVPAASATALSILFGAMNLLLAAAGGILTGMGSTVGLPQMDLLRREAEAEGDAEA